MTRPYVLLQKITSKQEMDSFMQFVKGTAGEERVAFWLTVEEMNLTHDPQTKCRCFLLELNIHMHVIIVSCNIGYYVLCETVSLNHRELVTSSLR